MGPVRRGVPGPYVCAESSVDRPDRVGSSSPALGAGGVIHCFGALMARSPLALVRPRAVRWAGVAVCRRPPRPDIWARAPHHRVVLPPDGEFARDQTLTRCASIDLPPSSESRPMPQSAHLDQATAPAGETWCIGRSRQSSRFRILPVAVIGKLVTNSSSRGYLYAAILVLTHAISSSSEVGSPGSLST